MKKGLKRFEAHCGESVIQHSRRCEMEFVPLDETTQIDYRSDTFCFDCKCGSRRVYLSLADKQVTCEVCERTYRLSTLIEVSEPKRDVIQEFHKLTRDCVSYHELEEWYRALSSREEALLQHYVKIGLRDLEKIWNVIRIFK